MLFNSLEFAVFLPLVFCVYWFVLKENLKTQNLWIVFASYVFYGWWDWRFLSLILFSSLVDFFVGFGLSKLEDQKKRRTLLIASICVNLGLLGFFKYYNFFAASFAESFTLLGKPMEVDRLNIVLPVGISFYTFQSMSYAIDVYRRKLEPTKNLVTFLAFVSFFPQLVAGPIERATNLLPQFSTPRAFDPVRAADGMRQILWGLFKKIVIADNCATYVNQIFNGYTDFTGSTLALGAFLFAFQIYGDFSGYSDIAIGVARLFGFSLMRNFAFPYFSRDIAEFWRRWHISLSTWFRDYMYLPLGGSRGTKAQAVRNTLFVFVTSGFWHGANWTFLTWGLLNGLYFLPLLLTNRNRSHTNIAAEGRVFATTTEIMQISFTFLLTLIAWVFFRSASLTQAIDYLSRCIDKSIFSLPEVFPLTTLAFIIVLVVIEWLQREKAHGLELGELALPRPARWAVYYAVVVIIFMFGGASQDFIYFQF